MAGAVRATSPCGPFLCTAWHPTQLTLFLAWALCGLETCLAVLTWHFRQVWSACVTASLRGLRISDASADSACLLAGPWQDSHALPSQPRFFSPSTTKCGLFLNALEM